MLNDLEKKIIASLQEDLPIDSRPYRLIARDIGVPEERILEVLRSLCDRGIIRRFGATLRHQKSGFAANAMGAWIVDESLIDAVGEQMAAFPEVSHCYRRNPTDGWPYNLYTMIHAGDEDSCVDTARRMSEATGVTDFELLFSREELKKTSMVYFPTDDDE
ncbi:Siroheme decarboxylase AhbB, alternate heme biosynthesis pathway [Olavius algarvensis associated proteobacterium Delta 3]|nr:Siroheme decarboxylase AhbB, alternate heme biosynthesis pathway [Olavius algarvensis associated proteobacterium Delta 3]CAB5150159.1 Siroheme decarboxylase AhbB, alternate heme biosynthesis pathway [Olavius algarvensis associated proteobacterium Delta 3]